MFRHAAMVGLLSTALAAHAAPCSVPAAMHPQPATAAGLRAESDLWLKALNTQDRALLNCILSEDYLDTDWQGQLRDRQSRLNGLAKRSAIQQEVQIEKIRVMQDTGFIWGINRVKDAAGKPIGSVRFTDVYLYRNQRWQAVASQETRVRQQAAVHPIGSASR